MFLSARDSAFAFSIASRALSRLFAASFASLDDLSFMASYSDFSRSYSEVASFNFSSAVFFPFLLKKKDRLLPWHPD